MRFLTSGIAALALGALVAPGCHKSSSHPAPATGWPIKYKDSGGGSGVVREKPDGTQRSIAGTFLADYTLASGFTWVLAAPTIFGDDSGSSTPTLTIPAGTTILGSGGTPPSMLVIKRSAKIQAVGTSTNPIVFTSSQPVGSRAPGDWGGLVINGWSQVNDGTAASPPLGEGGSGPYGGFASNSTLNTADNSGTLQYVRVEYAGHIFTSSDELNGIAFQAVGSGTTVDHIQIHRNLDDGIEFFGGTVEAKYILLTGNVDDSLDWTFGFAGKLQHIVVQQYTSGGDRCMECDNNGGTPTATPQAQPWISNITLIGPAGNSGLASQGTLLRAGTQARIFNAIWTDTDGAAWDIDGQDSWDGAYTDNSTNGGTFAVLSGNTVIENSILVTSTNNTNFDGDADPNGTGTGGSPPTDGEADFYADIQADSTYTNNQTTTTTQLNAPTNQSSPDFTAKTGSLALTTGWLDPNSGDSFWDTVSHIGGMGTTNWASGWSTSAQN